MSEVINMPTRSSNSPINSNDQSVIQQVQSKLAQAQELGQKGEFAEAQNLCNEILSLMPDNPQALHFLGMISLQRNEADKAIPLFEKAIPMMPFVAEAHLHLGVAYGQKGDLQKATASLKQALRLNNKLAEAHYNLGLVYLRMNDLVNAQTHYLRTAELNPNSAMAQMGLGNLYYLQNKIPAALSAYEEALKLQPNYPECYFNLALALEKDGRMQQALESYYQALQLNSGYIDALNGAGALLMRMHQYEQAVNHFKTIINQVPQYLPAIKNCGEALNAMHNYQEAAAILKQGLEQYPEQVELLGDYFTAIRNNLSWQEYDSVRQMLIAKIKVRLEQDIPSGIQPELALSLGLGIHTESLIAKNYAKFAFQHLPRNQFDFSKRNQSANRRLKIGYVFGDFPHGLKPMFNQILAKHNRAHFNVSAYFIGSNDNHSAPNEMAALADHFADFSYFTTNEMCERIYQDEIDILVDLSGYSDSARPEIFAAKPAPVQIGYLNYLSTSGADFMDYYLGDAVICPDSFQNYYSEKLLTLPHAFAAIDNPRLQNIPSKASCHLPEDKFIFSSICTKNNIEPKIFAAWLKILMHAPESVLWLHIEEDGFENRLRQFAQQNKVDPERLIFAKLEEDNFLQLANVDLYLDTKVYQGHAALNVLATNVPVLTVLGDTTATRTSASLLNTLNLEELIAADLSEYVQKAITFATSPENFSNLKQKLISSEASNPLFDPAELVQAIETQYQQAWQNII